MGKTRGKDLKQESLVHSLQQDWGGRDMVLQVMGDDGAPPRGRTKTELLSDSSDQDQGVTKAVER